MAEDSVMSILSDRFVDSHGTRVCTIQKPCRTEDVDAWVRLIAERTSARLSWIRTTRGSVEVKHLGSPKVHTSVLNEIRAYDGTLKAKIQNIGS